MALQHTSNTVKIIGAVVLIMIIAAVALTFAGAIPTIASSSTITIQHNASANFYLPDSKNISSVFLAQDSNSSVVIYISKNPILLNGITQLDLAKGQTSNLSLSGGNADLQITLVSSSPQGATFSLAYVPKTLGIKPSGAGVRLNDTRGQPVQPLTTQATTTIPAAPTTTVKATTTVAVVNITQHAYEVANSTNLGTLMNLYKALYVREAATCTRNTYDSAYATTYGMVPTGPATFANVTLIVPINIKQNVTQISSDIFNVSYYGIRASGVDRRDLLLQMQISLSGQYVISSTFGGDFKDLGGYAQILQGYQSLNGSDDCSAYIV